jgi:hypothetical protein
MSGTLGFSVILQVPNGYSQQSIFTFIMQAHVEIPLSSTSYHALIPLKKA